VHEFQFLEGLVRRKAQRLTLGLEIALQGETRQVAANLPQGPQRRLLHLEIHIIRQLDELGDGVPRRELAARARGLVAHRRAGMMELPHYHFPPAQIGAPAHGEDGADLHGLCRMAVRRLNEGRQLGHTGVGQRFQRPSPHLQIFERVLMDQGQDLAELAERLWRELPRLPQQDEMRQTLDDRDANLGEGFVEQQPQQVGQEQHVVVFPQSFDAGNAHVRVLVAQRQPENGVEVHLEIIFRQLRQRLQHSPPLRALHPRPGTLKAPQLLSIEAGKARQVHGPRGHVFLFQSPPEGFHAFSAFHTS